jgi:hypothetical protein
LVTLKLRSDGLDFEIELYFIFFKLLEILIV